MCSSDLGLPFTVALKAATFRGNIANARQATDPVESPQPAIQTISPVWAKEGDAAVTLKLTGFNFVRRSRVFFDGVSVPWKFVSPTELEVMLSADLLKRPGRYDIVVNNPEPVATAPAAGKTDKAPIIVRDVKFAQTTLGGQINKWNRMQVELMMVSDNPDAKALNKKWLDKVKVTVTQVYKTASKKPEDWNYYRASSTVLTIESNQPRSVLFYLPGDIVKRDVLHKEPDYYFVQLEVAGNEVPLFDPKGTIVAAQERRYESYLLADQLRQSSDDLTRLARTYVVSGDARFEEQYWAVLDIRNGKTPRPLHAERIYWDFMAVDGVKPRAEVIADILASIANYLAKSGWDAKLPWGTTARLPAGFDPSLAGRDNRRTPGLVLGADTEAHADAALAAVGLTGRDRAVAGRWISMLLPL